MLASSAARLILSLESWSCSCRTSSPINLFQILIRKCLETLTIDDWQRSTTVAVKGNDLCLRFLKKVRSFTPSDLRSGIRSLSSIRPICKCRCPPLLTKNSKSLSLLFAVGPGCLQLLAWILQLFQQLIFIGSLPCQLKHSYTVYTRIECVLKFPSITVLY
jgi:hypothetical protein